MKNRGDKIIDIIIGILGIFLFGSIGAFISSLIITFILKSIIPISFWKTCWIIWWIHMGIAVLLWILKNIGKDDD